MNSSEIIDRLRLVIPTVTSDFGDNISVQSITASGATATVSATGHGAIEGGKVSIFGADAPVQIDVATFLRAGTSATFKTLQDHDLTLSQRDKNLGGKKITISGANETEFNGEFYLSSIPNRREIVITVLDSGSTSMTGSALVENANGDLFNGLFTVFDVNSGGFSYTLPRTYSLPAVGNIVASSNINIFATLDINNYLTENYDIQHKAFSHLVVMLGDVTRSKNKNEVSDAPDSASGNTAYFPKVVQQFAVYIIQKVHSLREGGAVERDKVEDVYIPALFKALDRAHLQTGFTNSIQKAVFNDHGKFSLSSKNGKTVYVHEVVFSLVVDISDEDSAMEDLSVAMRDVDYTFSSNVGTGLALASVDIDEVPIG